MGRFLLIVLLIVVIVAVGVPAVRDLGQVFADVAQANAVSDMADAYKTQSLTNLGGMFLICASNVVSIIGAFALMAAGVMFYMRRIKPRSLPAAKPSQQFSAQPEYVALPAGEQPVSELDLAAVVEKLSEWLI